MTDLAGSREQRGSAFELYRKPQHMHSMSATEAMNASVENEANFTPKTKKKLSKKPSFIKNAVLDLFRPKSKNTHKVTRQKSLCEKDLQNRQVNQHAVQLRREKSDLSGVDMNMRNAQIRSHALARSNSTCDKLPVLKPILKRQSSFCDGRSGVTCTVRDYDAVPMVKNLRRQNSMCEMETEPKVKTTLRRQNSLIEYGRRGFFPNTNFNMITKIDPVYQRQMDMKHEPFHPRQPLPPEPIYQSKDHVIYDPIPKPRRTFTSNTSFNNSTESPYATKSEVFSNRSFESPYGTREQYVINHTEPIYGTRRDYDENPYSIRSPEPIYQSKSISESPYGTKEQISNRQRKHSESLYATKEEMLRQRFSESPYVTKDEILKQQIRNESPYSTRSSQPSWNESMFSNKTEPMRQLTPTMSTYPGRVSPSSRCMSEPPYASKSEMLTRVGQLDSPFAYLETRSCSSESPYGMKEDPNIIKDPNSTIDVSSKVESTYVSRQEILNQKAALIASRESPYGTKQQVEDKFEIIRQRNQAKKDLIYQTRKEVTELPDIRTREPVYVSKRELKDSVIYESHNESRENINVIENGDSSSRSSPYELSDANHLSRRDPVYQTKVEALGQNISDNFQAIDFSALRLTESKTDNEKQQSLRLEQSILQGEPIYQPRLHGKPAHISNVLKSTSPPVPYDSTTSMETHYASECSMNFDSKPQSTPYTSQELPGNQTNFDKLPVFKSNRSVTFCEKIAEKSTDSSQNTTDNTTGISHNETTVLNNEDTVIHPNTEVDNHETLNDGPGKRISVEPDGPHTTWGVFDSEGGILEDRQWGVSLIIPPKAIAPGIKQKIYFTVSDPRHSQNVGGPPIDMDNGEAMLSPLVMCGPQGLVFRRAVTLRLPHCANAVPSLGLTIRATDSEAHLSTDWDNIHLPATTTTNTVAVKVDHF